MFTTIAFRNTGLKAHRKFKTIDEVDDYVLTTLFDESILHVIVLDSKGNTRQFRKMTRDLTK